MARVKKPANALEAIASERSKLNQRLAELEAAEKAELEAQRDAGRPVFLAALKKVKIQSMSRAEAKELAAAIARYPAADLLARIASA